MNFNSAQELFATARDPRAGKPVANNTRLFKTADGAYTLRFHLTDVITFHEDGRVEFNTGGWRTMSTRDRMNYCDGLRVSTEKGIWHVQPGVCTDDDQGMWSFYREWDDPEGRGALRMRVPYFDGITFKREGDSWVCTNGMSGEEYAELVAQNKRVHKAITSYVGLAIRELQKGLPMPSGGDCWYCAMKTADGQALGDAVDTLHPDGTITKEASYDHLWGHIEEGYVVPSLLANACLERGYSETGVYFMLRMNHEAQTMGGKNDRYESVRHALRSYLKARLMPFAEGSAPSGAARRHYDYA